MAKILEFKLEKLQELAENCGCADLAIIDLEDGSYEDEALEYDSDEWIEGDGIEVDDEFGEFNGNYDEDLADVIEFSDAEEDQGLLKQKIMQAISDVLGETAHSDKLHGGKADYVPDYKFNKKELRKGIRHELEHSDDSDIAKETAEDHMMEDPKYYTHLQKHMGQYEKKNKKKIKEQQAFPTRETGLTWAQLKVELENIVNSVKQQNRGQVSTAVWKSAIQTLKDQGKGMIASVVATGILGGGAVIAAGGIAGVAGGGAGVLVLAGAGIYGVFKAIKDHKKEALSSEEVRNVIRLCGMDYNLSQVIDDKLEDEFFEKILKPYIEQKIRTAPDEKISDISVLFSDWLNKKTDQNGLAGSQHKISPPGQGIFTA